MSRRPRHIPDPWAAPLGPVHDPRALQGPTPAALALYAAMDNYLKELTACDDDFQKAIYDAFAFIVPIVLYSPQSTEGNNKYCQECSARRTQVGRTVHHIQQLWILRNERLRLRHVKVMDLSIKLFTSLEEFSALSPSTMRCLQQKALQMKAKQDESDSKHQIISTIALYPPQHTSYKRD